MVEHYMQEQLSIFFCLLGLQASSQVTSSVAKCTPLSLPVGSQADVVAKSATFLTKVETVQVHPV